MFHLVARSLHGDPLFRTWEEARRLWDDLVGATPGLAALVLMPNHVHLVHPVDVQDRMRDAVSGYARWWNHRHGLSGRVFERLPPAQVIEESKKVSRHVRYVHLNPCRAEGLVNDPLAWPFSTHRDACALASPAVVPRVKNVASFHKFVSSDPRVNVGGTPLPSRKLEASDPLAVLHAVSAVTRTPVAWFGRRSPARSLYLRSAVQLCPTADRTHIGELVGVGRDIAVRAAHESDPNTAIVATVIGDSRFKPLHDRPLRWGMRLP